MSYAKRLLQAYSNFISIPWPKNLAASQRVVFCIYEPAEELKVRAIVGEFELSTKGAGHGWSLFDLTDSFPAWLSQQKYAKSYFERPELLASPESPALRQYRSHLTQEFEKHLSQHSPDESSVVALLGAGSLFGLLKVKDVVDDFSPLVEGRLVVFFPGTYESNNYRLLDAYDGWGYLAVPLTAEREA